MISVVKEDETKPVKNRYEKGRSSYNCVEDWKHGIEEASGEGTVMRRDGPCFSSGAMTILWSMCIEVMCF